MKKFASFLLWLLVGLLGLAGLDQFLLRVEPRFAAWSAVHTFYGDFRGRLLQLEVPRLKETPPAALKPTPKTAPAATKAAKPSPPVKSAPAPTTAAGYVWADEQGALRFADTLDQVPPDYRKDAQPLAR